VSWARAAALRTSFLLWSLIGTIHSSEVRAAFTPGTVQIGGRFDTYGIVAFDAESPDQNPAARLDLYAEQRLLRNISWRLALTGRIGGPPEHTSGAGAFDLGHTFQNISPSLEYGEAYFDYAGDDFDLRVGLQKFFWGRLDSVQPNDLLSPREAEDPFLTDAVDAKIAVPALALSYYPPLEDWLGSSLSEPRLTVVWQPIDVPWRFPLLTERWYPPAGLADPLLEIPSLGAVPCPCLLQVTQQALNSPAPARRFDNGNFGLQISARTGSVDWSVLFFDGFDPASAFVVPIRLELEPDPVLGSIGTAVTQIQPAYERFQAVGGDFAFAAGDFTVRGEANWRFRRPYPMDLRNLADRVINDPAKVQTLLEGGTIVEPAFAQRDSLAWGLGVDTLLGGFLPILEVYQLVLVHNDQPLLVKDVDTRLMANVSRRFFRDRIEAELIATWGIESGYGLLRSLVSFDLTDALELRLGILGIWGRERSLIGQFNENSELFGGVRYRF
jgi:hypothetical protein